MVKKIMRDPLFLAQKSVDATEADKQIVTDLLALIKYTADEDKLEKVLENPQVIKTPVVRNGKQSTLGYQPDVWKGWN